MKRMINNAENLEHIYFIISDIDFFDSQEYTLNDKNGEPYKLAEHIRYCADYSMPCIIFSSDYLQGGWLLVSFPTIDHAKGIYEARFTKSDTNEHSMCTVNVNFKTSKLTTISTAEEFLSADNVKTLFGSQSIIGTGNIDLYRHQLTLNYDGEYETLSLIVYSSSNLNVDSLQDLTTLLKPNSNTLYFGNTTTSVTPYTFQIIYDNNVWKTGPISEDVGKPNNNITSVSDIVTTI